jgi:predicted transglutaminase-like cysteine proteinase
MRRGPEQKGVTMGVSGPARALAQAMMLAFVPLIFSEAVTEPIELATALPTPILSPEPRVGSEAMRNPGPVRLAAIDPRAANSSPSHSAGDEPFGLIALRAPEGELWRKWRRVQQEIRMESEVLALCRASPLDCSSEPARRFLAMIETAQARQGRARLGEINRAINLSIRPMSDLAQYGVVDLWTSPLATLAAGAGDCEDYAIAKYVALREAGLDNEDLRLLIVRDTRLHEDHAVVAARLDGRWLVLDNRRLVLLEDIQLEQYVPMFEIDDEGVKRLVSGETPRSLSRNAPNAMPAASDAAPAVH